MIDDLFDDEFEEGLEDGFDLKIFGHYMKFPTQYDSEDTNTTGDYSTFDPFINDIREFSKTHKVYDVQINMEATDDGMYHEAWVLYELEDDELERDNDV